MKVYRKEWKSIVPWSLEETWNFFSRPENLEKMVPKDMKFEILSDLKNIEMYEGMMILYKVTPMLGLKLRWCTEITKIEDKKYFVDEQRFGPYAMWHHEHHFRELEDGQVEMIDKLYYAIPFGIFGRIANSMFVSKRVDEIFSFREGFISEQRKRGVVEN